jgi:ABC-type lipoprotein export system ATPase subunit
VTAPLLHLEGVARSVRLPDGSLLEILRRIDLTVHPGEHVGIVGRSGTGKSTLLNILGLLDRPTGGQMLWDGAPTARLSQRAASRIRGAQIGFVFQQFNLLPGRTALENVAHPLLYGTAADVRTRKRRARDVLERLGLAASSSGWRSPAPWCAAPGCCWRTSPPAPWTSTRDGSSWTS